MEIQDNYRQFRLDNGLLVALENTNTSTIVGTLRVHHGGIHEQEGEEGIAHFVEHAIMTGGTQKYAPEEVDEIRANFQYINASTSVEKTSFPVQMVSEDLESYLDFISDVVFHPRFDVRCVDQERYRVLREMSDRRGHPAYLDFQEYGKIINGNHPTMYDGLGKESVIQNASIEQIRSFHKRGYNATNMDLILVGGLPDNIENIIKSYFEKKPSGIDTRFKWPSANSLENTTILHKFAPELLNQNNPDSSNANLRLYFRMPPVVSRESPALTILSYMLGGNSDSLLFSSISRRKGLAYNIECDYNGGHNIGGLEINGNIHALRINECIDAIFHEINLLQTELIPEKKFVVFKKHLKYSVGEWGSSNKGKINVIFNNLDCEIKVSNWGKMMDAVTADDIRNVAQKYLSKSQDDGKYVLLVRDPLKK